MAQETAASWCDAAPAGQRAEWAGRLARALIDGMTPKADRDDIEAILFQIAGDPAASVRRSLAVAVAEAPDVPKRLIKQLARDTDSVAAPVIMGSSHLDDTDLIELVLTAREKPLQAVLRRATLSCAVCAAIAGLGTNALILDLLDHPHADIGPDTLRGIAEAFGHVAEIRGALFDRADLPATIRQALMKTASQAVAASPLAQLALGARQSARVGEEACHRGTAAIVGNAPRGERARLIDDLVAADQLSPAVMLRLACSGLLEALTEALSRLSGVAPRRVRAVLVEGRRIPFVALCARAGLPDASVPILFHAVDVWRLADERGEPLHAAEVAARVMGRMRDDLSDGETRTLEPALAFLRGLAREMASPVAPLDSAPAIAA
ncbi:DUF2336 domain-containing protein [Fulvimarina sp. 2208YS6-2-32]|uniref:DUF2336 domain-containing protein n=1 Tax=Fulvimarina uroteuthidis TaxID=3098149 RepID=A0ABU5HXZ5_9HYPH|nr:DUF2336 domain-containing protein [Fulvimarina sp. 2208YS6-2-32]MDY8108013.1 DUF2336 domain-containing protein [Fulvimarina sp. 2208YS6-2-32]